MLQVNERPVPFKEGMTVGLLADKVKPDADLLIVNGYPASRAARLRDGDHCWLIRRGEAPAAEEMDRLLHARHTPGVHDIIKKSTIGIMGLGGLGSMAAIALARMGVGKLVLADYDVVDPTNLNRQQYFVDQIGMRKTEALQANLARVNPYVETVAIDTQLTEQSIPVTFQGVDVLVECFDDPVMKAAALRAVLHGLPGCRYVGASGVAGYGDNNVLRTRKLYPGIYLVGDGESAAAPGRGLMAPWVGIAAHQQANQVVRLLLGIED